jgi:hypothetical protein
MADFGLAELARHQKQHMKIIAWLEKAVARLLERSDSDVIVTGFIVSNDEANTVTVDVLLGLADTAQEFDFPLADLIIATL